MAGFKLNCNTQRRDATSKPDIELGLVFATDQTLDLPNLAVIWKPNSTRTSTSYPLLCLSSYILQFPATSAYFLVPPWSSLFTQPLSSFISVDSYGAHLGCLPRSILAADRLSTTPDTRLVSALLHYLILAVSPNNTFVLMAHQPFTPTVALDDALVGQTRPKPIREAVGLT